MALRSLFALLLAAALMGCASSTVRITNDKTSDAVKAKSFKSYKEVLLLPPKEDPRQVVPRVVQEITTLGYTVRLLDPNKPVEPSQGTGFVIDQSGLLLTCAHVLGEQKEATVTLNGQRLLADVVKADSKVDLALLKLREPLPADAAVLGFRGADRPAAMGEDVFTIGYPLARILGNNARMSKGLLSATTGLRDDVGQLQVSAEIQPGSSGGPLLDREGNVIGIINQTLSPAAVAQSTGGALPQNVNFAIKTAPAHAFLDTAQEPALKAVGQGIGLERAGKAVAKIQAGIVSPDAEQRADKMFVRLSYVSLWDIWYRFRVFVLAAFDFDTQEPLFVVGQGRDNLISNEDIVIRDTMAQFAKAVSTR